MICKMSIIKLIDRFLKDEEFQQMVEEKIGPLIAPVRVEWNENKIKFFGRKQVFVLKIDETLEELRKKSPITDTNIKEINTKCQYCKRDLAEEMQVFGPWNASLNGCYYVFY